LDSKPIVKAAFVKTNFSLSTKLQASYKTDTLGTVTMMLVYYQTNFQPVLKIIDLPTSEVEVSYEYNTEDWGVNNKFIVKDFKKYFGNKPNVNEKKNPLLFNAGMSEFLKAEKAELDKFYERKINSFGERLEQVSKQLNRLKITEVSRVLDYGYDEKGKLEDFYIDVPSGSNLQKDDIIDIFVQYEVEDYKYYSKLSVVTIKEVTDGKFKVKPFSLMKKKIAEALEGDADVVFTENRALIREMNRGDEPYKRIQVVSKCGNCYSDMDRKILSMSSTKLIARNIDGLTNYFTSKYNNENFLDYDMINLQNKQEGVDYILEATAAGIKATDVKTGRVAFESSKEKGGLARMLSLDGPNVSNLMMDIMDVDFQIVKVLKEKNGKLEKFIAYNPIGFGRTYKIVKVYEEEVDDRMVNREEIIGKCYIGKVYTNTLAEVKVAKGEKELYSAIQAGDKVRYRF
jgi:hypothetical protein